MLKTILIGLINKNLIQKKKMINNVWIYAFIHKIKDSLNLNSPNA